MQYGVVEHMLEHLQNASLKLFVEREYDLLKTTAEMSVAEAYCMPPPDAEQSKVLLGGMHVVVVVPVPVVDVVDVVVDVLVTGTTL